MSSWALPAVGVGVRATLDIESEGARSEMGDEEEDGAGEDGAGEGGAGEGGAGEGGAGEGGAGEGGVGDGEVGDRAVVEGKLAPGDALAPVMVEACAGVVPGADVEVVVAGEGLSDRTVSGEWFVERGSAPAITAGAGGTGGLGVANSAGAGGVGTLGANSAGEEVVGLGVETGEATGSLVGGDAAVDSDGDPGTSEAAVEAGANTPCALDDLACRERA